MSAMPELDDAPALGWLQHTVRPLLRPTGAFCAAYAGPTGRIAASACPATRKPKAGGCFGGAEGEGCQLSREERLILGRVREEAMSWDV